MKFLFLRIENQWVRYDLDNSEPFDAQSQIEENDSIDLIKLKSAIQNDILKNLTDLAFAPAFGLSDISMSSERRLRSYFRLLKKMAAVKDRFFTLNSRREFF